MIKKCIFTLLITYISLTTGCISEFNAKLPSGVTDILAVQGNIIGDTTAVFVLTQSVPLDYDPNDEKQYSDYDRNAVLTIIDSNGNQSLPATALGGGTYSIAVGHLDPNVKYALQIECNGDTYRSEPAYPVVTPEIDSVTFIQHEEYGDVIIRISTHDSENQPKYFMWRYIEDWEIVSYFDVQLAYDMNTGIFTAYDEEKNPNPYYYCWKKNITNPILVGSSNDYKENRIVNKDLYQNLASNERFQYLYSTLITQYALSKPAYEYYLSSRKSNEEMGGLFTPQPSEITGNITCVNDPSKRIIGYVDVINNITSKRIFIRSSQISRNRARSCTLYTNGELQALLQMEELNFRLFALYGYDPVIRTPTMDPNDTSVTPESWAARSCTNCTYNGGSVNKPEFWPQGY